MCLTLLLHLLLASSSTAKPRNKAKTPSQQFKDIDTNEDRTVSATELGAWFTYQDIEYQKRNARELFMMYDSNGDQRVTWDEYAPASFGNNHQEACTEIFLGMKTANFADLDKDVAVSINSAVRRWKLAGGFSMSLDEFTGFAYPELYQHMRRALVQETIERYDRDENKEVTVYELLNKKFKYDRHQADQFSKGTLPQVDSFLLGLHDTNQDGILDKRELGFWCMENRQLLHRQQSDNVFGKLDSDGNSRVSLKEFTDNYHHIRNSIIGFSMRDEL